MVDPSTGPNRRLFLAAGLLLPLCLGVIGYKLVTGPSLIPIRDFAEYYSAGAVNLNRGNPYDSTQLLPIQRQLLNEPELAEATMMWNPPWMLPFVSSFAFLNGKAAHLLWLTVQLFALVLSVIALWRVYGGPAELWLIAVVVGLVFAPFLVLLWYGQVGGLCLLGLAGFLYFHGDRRPIPAGVCVALTAIKPHLLFAFGLVLVLDAIRDRRTRIAMLWGGLTVLSAAGLAYLINPDVYTHYRAAGWTDSSGTHTSPKDWAVPLLSYYLRMAIAPDHFNVQFVPTVLVSVLAVGYYWVRRANWNWPNEAPRLVFASVIFCAYGAWLFDLVVLLVPVIQASVWLTRRGVWPIGLITVFMLLNAGSALGPPVLNAVTGDIVPLHWFIYFSPAVLGLYLWAGRSGGRPTAHSDGRSFGTP